MKSQNFAYTLSQAIGITTALFSLFLLQANTSLNQSFTLESASYPTGALEIWLIGKVSMPQL
jgi:hypothetical protein